MTRPRTRLSLQRFGACLAILVTSRGVYAENGASLVALVVSDPKGPSARRAFADLDALGFEVLVLSPPDETSVNREPLDQVARDVGAFAALRLVAPAHTEVWASNPRTGRVVTRELDTKGGAAPDDALAVGAVELLRASLVELQAMPAPPPSSAPPAPAPPSLASTAREPLFSLRLGAGSALAATGATPDVDAAGSLGWAISSRVGARVFGAFTIAPARLEVAEGSIDVASQLFGAEVTYAFADAGARWIPDVALGAAIVRTTSEGSATPPFVSESGAQWLAGPVVRAGLAYSVADAVRLRGDATVLVTTSRPAIRVAGADVARWESPTVGATLGLEMLFGR